ncbi:MAG: toll/interleukin-1 receptor domain-containing protein, partial [Pirellula sp.]
PIRDALQKLGGMFDEDFLDSQVLRDGLGGFGSGPSMSRSLLLSFMLSTGVCFPLLRSWETSQSKRQTYLSPNHLPMSDKEVQGIRELEFAGVTDELVLESPMIHQGHWHALMRLVAQQHGGEATIYRRAIRIAGHYYSQEGASGQARKDFSCLVEYKPVGYKEAGEIESEGKIHFRSIGLDDSNRSKLRNLLESPLPGFMGNATSVISEYQPMATKRPEEPTIFFSYAWDYKVPKDENAAQKAVRVEYARFVDELEKRVNEKFPGLARVVRDKNENQRGDWVPAFMDRIQTCKYALVVLSDKYLTSWFCMYEWRELFASLIADNRGRSRVQFIIHPSVPTLEKNDEFWANMVSVWDERHNLLKQKRGIQTTGERGSNSKPTGLILDEELEKACQVELGMNSLDRWWDLPMHFMSKILEIPKESQMLEMHKKLIYEKEKHGKLTSESIDECIEATIEWLQLLEDGGVRSKE